MIVSKRVLARSGLAWLILIRSSLIGSCSWAKGEANSASTLRPFSESLLTRKRLKISIVVVVTQKRARRTPVVRLALVCISSLLLHQTKRHAEKRVFLFGFRRPEGGSTRLLQLLGRSKFALCQGFRLQRKRLYGAKAPPARRPDLLRRKYPDRSPASKIPNANAFGTFEGDR